MNESISVKGSMSKLSFTPGGPLSTAGIARHSRGGPCGPCSAGSGPLYDAGAVAAIDSHTGVDVGAPFNKQLYYIEVA